MTKRPDYPLVTIFQNDNMLWILNGTHHYVRLESYWFYYRHSLRLSLVFRNPFSLQLLSFKITINLTLNKNLISNMIIVGSVGKSVVSSSLKVWFGHCSTWLLPYHSNGEMRSGYRRFRNKNGFSKHCEKQELDLRVSFRHPACTIPYPPPQLHIHLQIHVLNI